MKNDRITPKERGLIKGSIRRVFSRSELRRSIVEASRIVYTDAKRPRVTKWSRCPLCTLPTPTYLMEVDHIEPIVPIDTSLEDMCWDDVVNRVWCLNKNLVAVCKPCHRQKTKAENAERRRKKRAI